MHADPTVAAAPTQQFVPPVVAVAATQTQLAALDPSATARADIDDSREIGCLALTIYHEARGESERGKLAVGHVVINRTRSLRFPASVCAVVQQGGQQPHRCQFSWWCDGRSDRPKDEAALRESLRLAEAIYYGYARDPTGGALWYHATVVEPSWSKSFGPGKRIGHHVFYRGERNWPARIVASLRAGEQFLRAGPARLAAPEAEGTIAQADRSPAQAVPVGVTGMEETRLWWPLLLVAALDGAGMTLRNGRL